jgi:hypothetical protein
LVVAVTDIVVLLPALRFDTSTIALGLIGVAAAGLRFGVRLIGESEVRLASPSPRFPCSGWIFGAGLVPIR